MYFVNHSLVTGLLEFASEDVYLFERTHGEVILGLDYVEGVDVGPVNTRSRLVNGWVRLSYLGGGISLCQH